MDSTGEGKENSGKDARGLSHQLLALPPIVARRCQDCTVVGAAPDTTGLEPRLGPHPSTTSMTAHQLR